VINQTLKKTNQLRHTAFQCNTLQHIATWMHRRCIRKNVFLFINMNVCLFTCHLCWKEIQSNLSQHWRSLFDLPIGFPINNIISLSQHITTLCYLPQNAGTWTHRRNTKRNGSSLWAYMQLVQYFFSKKYIPTYCNLLQITATLCITQAQYQKEWKLFVSLPLNCVKQDFHKI